MKFGKKIVLTKKMKWILGCSTGAVVALIGTFLFLQQNNTTSAIPYQYTSTKVKEGTIASSTILSGTVKALSEQYVYFDANKGAKATATVSVGDNVTKGQQLVQYDKSTAQAAYDTAVRNLNKIGRQINTLKTTGVASTTSSTTDPDTGETQEVTVPPSEQSIVSYNQQLQDLNDTYADAQAEVNKAQEGLNHTVVTSDIDGKVVEVNQSLDPSAKTSQTIVHVATEGQLQVRGTLTEYDLVNIKVGEDVKIKSKVYPDKTWTGKISYVSNYPKDNSSDASTGTAAGAVYEYKVDLTSDVDVLKQGFSVSVEVVNSNPFKLVPVNAVLPSGKKNYVWTYNSKTGKVRKVAVVLGKSDAERQEIKAGLEKNQEIIANPNDELKDGQVLKDVMPSHKG